MGLIVKAVQAAHLYDRTWYYQLPYEEHRAHRQNCLDDRSTWKWIARNVPKWSYGHMALATLGLSDEERLEMEESVRYERHGYIDRRAYLYGLSEDYGIPIERVEALAELLGPTEDFDGLLTMLAEMEDEG